MATQTQGTDMPSNMALPTGVPATCTQKQTLMERRGMQRPSLSRSATSFSQAIASVTPADNINLSDITQRDILDSSTKDLIKEDIKLVKAVQNEPLPPSSTTPNGFTTPGGTNRYAHWPCAFDIAHPALTPSAVPRAKAEFLTAVNNELNTIKYLKAGLAKYVATINSEEHTVFPQSFLDSQEKSTQITVDQLGQVERHLRGVVEELERVQVGVGVGCVDGHEKAGEVSAELWEVYSHAKPWVARVRKIVVDSHVFYKTNYALVSDKRSSEAQRTQSRE